MQDSEQIKNQYMSVSLDDIVKANRAAKKGRGSFNKGGDKPTTTTKESSTSPKLNVLETSLDDIVKSQKKPYIKKSQNQQHQHQQFKVTINNNNNYNNNKYNQPHGSPQFQNRGLFNRNQPQQQQQFVNSNNRFNKNNVSPNYIKKYPQYHNNSRLKNIPRTSITDSIDHKFFDPRGIRDYSQVKKPTTASMNDNTKDNTTNGNNNSNNADDADELEYDEKGNELSFSVKVVNLPKSIIPSDIAYMFGVIGSLKDFELDTNNSTATVIFKKKTHALASIERYSGVELDGSLLILYEAENPPKQTSPPTTTTTTTSTTSTTTTATTEESNVETNPTTTTSEEMEDKEMEE
ncbi:hypothetical protein DDB_G0285363 [Dictyostelium discoideum AX4]|uniref:RRM domain-containing protein n=1 Tax=Dictyostelium discoideum TaxID=44689 RepID=Q54NB3_DICDI|nr:hypothetical protein DDB_G0285363 [Dictyostelium discoideum AX4]EAL64756.1 hypothetical protein DDB_G0285363 [Dictyostelium discoideum AX4]|eukprot:XP_638267.1 hypothetical protein DDB_G0285363 [Dictyostelium discoideum AX4]